MKLRMTLAAVFASGASPAFAGPPYLTDDPVPTDVRHWEIFAFAAGGGHASQFDGNVGFDINYGVLPGLQLTATVPLSVSRLASEDWHGGFGDLEFAAKYRVIHGEEHGFSASVFPRVILPTAAHGRDEKTRVLLPVWLQKDFLNGTSLFGGGGYTINPGHGNRNYWQAGLAVTHELNKTISAGVELTREGSDADYATPETSAGAGFVARLSGRYALLFSGGPTWANHQTGYHVYGGLGITF